MKAYKAAFAATLLTAGLALSGCVANAQTGGEAKSDTGADATGAIAVDIKDDACGVATSSVPSGQVKFALANNGTVRNEFEILAPDKLRIVGERENLGPGTSTDYTIVLEPGQYFTACKKNMVGALVDVRELTVTDSGVEIKIDADEQSLRDQAVTNYTAYVRDQAGQLLEATKDFANKYTSGDMEGAKGLYAATRMFYERIEPTAEAFGDVDPALDEREADWQEADDKGTRPWTGWHPIEKDLWRPADYAGLNETERVEMAKGLIANTQKLYDLVYSNDFKVNLDEISNGAIALLEEVAISKITGEEEAFSHTDLWDFQANLEGAKVAFGNVESIAKAKDPALTEEINSRINDLQAELDKYKEGEGYKSYEQVDDAGRKMLSDKVNALRKPLAKLTEAILN